MRVDRSERRRRGRGRAWLWILGIAIVLALIVLLSLRAIAGFYTDKLWFDSLGYGDTWRQQLAARVVPAAVFTAAFFVIVLVNLVLTDRLAPTYRAMGPSDEFIDRYQRATAPFRGRIRILVSLIVALFVGVGVSAQWHEWILFTNRVDFGVEDPEFGMDVGFYVFQLPFLEFIFDWLFASFFILLFIVALAHYLNGGIRFSGPFERVTPQVKAHLSVILAVMALIMTARYYLDRFELTRSTSGAVQGAGATDLSARLPALTLLAIISIVAAALFLLNIVRRGWVLPVIAVGLWGFVAIIVSTIYPAYYQRFQVDPNELARERPYIERNIEATRVAFGLDGVSEQEYQYQEEIDLATLESNRASIDNARLWDPDITQATYQTLQGLQTYYRVDDVDVDRYMVNGQMRPAVIAARELNRAELPSQSWVNRHIVYTHGYGVVASPANQASGEGNPLYLTSDIPPVDDGIDVEVPELYFGEQLGGYALVNAEQEEFNYPREDGEDVTTRYEGSDGVEMSNLIRRGAFALRFGDINPLISGEIADSTKIVYQRDVMDRVEELAPFLAWDDDPYPAVIDGRVQWILDGYTTTNAYPYSQSASGPGGLSRDFNYVRNSVKATIDAYEGTVTLYVVDDDDPMVRAYSKAFPELFTSIDEMPPALRDHLRYPEDLFTVQSDVWGSYHVVDSTTFYQRNAAWLRSPDPTTGVVAETGGAGEGGETTEETTEPQAATSTSARMEPYYLMLRPPGEASEEFVIIQPFVPVSAENRQTRLSSFLMASSDPASYGELRSFEMPTGETVFGPAQVDNEINTNAVIAQQINLLSRGASTVLQGSLQLIPVGDSILYARPIYVQGGGGSSFPLFRFVAVFVQGEDPVLACNIPTALNELYGVPLRPEEQCEPIELPVDGEPPPEEAPSDDDQADGEEPTETTPAPEGGTDRPVDEILAEARQVYADAQAALATQDLGEYQRLVAELGTLLDEAAAAGG